MTLFKVPDYTQHPIAANLMPSGMSDPEFDAFCDDIEQRGIIMPVTLYEGMVLDGWHRYRAATKLGCSFKEITYAGKDPAGYITAVNVLRRKLGSLQRALVGCRMHREHGWTQRDVCKKLGISNEVVNLVLRALDSKNSKLIKRIESDTDFTRGMLKEELEDAGLLRKKVAEDAAPTGPNSIFDTKSMLSPAASSAGLEDLLGGTNGIDDEAFNMPDTGKKPSHPERRPKATAAQTMAEQFDALMADEKNTFIQMIWPVAIHLPFLDGKLTEPARAKGKERRAANAEDLSHALDTPIAALTRATKQSKTLTTSKKASAK